MYNTTNMTADGVIGLIKLADNLSGGALMIMFMFAIFLLTFISVKTYYPARPSFAVASFAVMIFSTLLKMINLVPDIAVFIGWIILIISIVLLYIHPRD